MNKKLIVGNWKMNPESMDEAKSIVRKIRRAAADLKKTEVVICPPFVYMPACVSSRGPRILHLGAQTVSSDLGGAHTGEVDAVMVRDLGAEYVIAGHSEQRSKGDTDEIISKRINAILESGLAPIVCVGEKERSEDGSHLAFLKDQIRATFSNVPKKYGGEIILAYEPVWAIGAKEPMAADQICEMALFVKKVFSDIFGPDVALKTKVLYGGSVNCRNAADIVSIGKVDGLLVGRESVNAVGFIELLKAVDVI